MRSGRLAVSHADALDAVRGLFILSPSAFLRLPPSPFRILQSTPRTQEPPCTCRCLSDFLEELGQAGELVRVEAEVDPRLEIAEITARVAAPRARRCCSPRFAGHEIPVLTNLLGSEGAAVPGLGRGRSGEMASAHRPTGRARRARGLARSPAGRHAGDGLGQRAAAASEGGGLPADRPPGQRRGPRARCRCCKPRRTTPAARFAAAAGLYGRARFASTSGRLLRPGAAGARPAGRLLGRPR